MKILLNIIQDKNNQKESFALLNELPRTIVRGIPSLAGASTYLSATSPGLSRGFRGTIIK